MTTLREAAQQALEAICGAKLCEINSMSSRHEMVRLMDKAITALRTALADQNRGWYTIDEINAKFDPKTVQEQAEPVQEPVAWLYEVGTDRTLHWHKPPLYGTPLFTAPIQRRPLTEAPSVPAALLTTWVSETEAVTEPLYKASPPARALTDAEISEIWFGANIPGLNETAARRLIRAAEARLRGG